MIKVLLGFFAILTLYSCGKPPGEEEISRFVSPDGKVEAVWCGTNFGGVTTGYTYTLYLVKRGDGPNWNYPLLSVDKFEDLRIEWRAVRTLEISYKTVRIYSFTNFWETEIEDLVYLYELRLRPSTETDSLSP